MHGYCSNCTFMHNFIPINVGVFLVKVYIFQYFFLVYTNLHLLMQVLREEKNHVTGVHEYSEKELHTY